jgi:hypothetical protein
LCEPVIPGIAGAGGIPGIAGAGGTVGMRSSAWFECLSRTENAGEKERMEEIIGE